MFFITQVLCAYICHRLILTPPPSKSYSYVSKRWFFLLYQHQKGLVVKIVVFLLVFCFKEGIQIGLYLLEGGPKDPKTSGLILL